MLAFLSIKYASFAALSHKKARRSWGIHIRFTQVPIKFQIANFKYQTNNNDQKSKFQTHMFLIGWVHWYLKFEIYL